MKLKKLLVISPMLLAFGALVGCNPKEVVDPEWMTRSNWYDLTNNAVAENIGKTVTVKVNGQNHLVRLIGIDHDVDENGNKLHTTWEFANLISDKDGYSLSYQWNDINVDDEEIGDVANYDYPNSTIRYALNGQGDNGGKELNPHTKGLILTAQKDKTKFDAGTYDKSVLSMLPNELQNKLKTVKKTVGVRASKDEDYVETAYTDKLFMLSGREIGSDSSLSDDKGFGTIYKYYESSSSTKTKSQVKSDYTIYHDVIINDPVQTYHKNIYNYAGQCEGMFTQYGGSYWLRSPFSNFARYGAGAYCCDETGSLQYHETYNHAFGIAPAFCI